MSNDEIKKIVDTLKYGRDPVPFAEEWRYVDSFTVDQAAYLWCGLEPSEKYDSFAPKNPRGFAAIKQWLIGAIEAKILPSQTEFPSLKLRADGNALVSRADLMAIAKQKSACPDFLVDTANPEPSQISEDVPSHTGSPRKKVGRPSKWNWDAIWAKFVYEAEMNGLPDTAEALGNTIVYWYSKGMSDSEEEGPEFDAPDLKTVLERIQPVYRIMKKDMGWVPQTKVGKG